MHPQIHLSSSAIQPSQIPAAHCLGPVTLAGSRLCLFKHMPVFTCPPVSLPCLEQLVCQLNIALSAIDALAQLIVLHCLSRVNDEHQNLEQCHIWGCRLLSRQPCSSAILCPLALAAALAARCPISRLSHRLPEQLVH